MIASFVLMPDSHFDIGENYALDLRNHLRADGEQTATQRTRHVVLGDPEKCGWVGRAGPRLPEMLHDLGLGGIDLRGRRIRDLRGKEAARLRSAVIAARSRR